MLAWSYLAGRSPEQIVLEPFAQHQRFAVCGPYVIKEIRIYQKNRLCIHSNQANEETFKAVKSEIVKLIPSISFKLYDVTWRFY